MIRQIGSVLQHILEKQGVLHRGRCRFACKQGLDRFCLFELHFDAKQLIGLNWPLDLQSDVPKSDGKLCILRADSDAVLTTQR